MLDRRTFIAAAPAVLFNVPAQSIAAPRSKESKSSMATNTHETTPNRFIEAGGIKYAYRRFGAARGVPMVFLQHFRGSMDDWDPLLTNGFAKSRPVILFDNAGVGLSGGSVPDTIGGMADKALEVIDAVGLTQIDLLGFSMGGCIAQILTLKRPSLVRRLILAGTGPGGGDGILPPDPRVIPILTSGQSGREERLMLFFEATETSQAAGRRYWDRTLTRQGEKDSFASVEAGKVMLTAIGKFSKAKVLPIRGSEKSSRPHWSQMATTTS